jgi:ankyrin repeat protein
LCVVSWVVTLTHYKCASAGFALRSFPPMVTPLTAFLGINKRVIIERGGDAMVQNEDGDTPLDLALLREQVEAARMLIERGADVTVKNNYGSITLHLASLHGHVEVVGILIERSADVTAQNNYGETPLHIASLYGQAEVVDVLIERGADATAQDKDGSTKSDQTEMSPQRYAEFVRILLEHGAECESQGQGWMDSVGSCVVGLGGCGSGTSLSPAWSRFWHIS